MSQVKYIISKIDGNKYCISNGQFTSHLKRFNHSRQSYHEMFVIGLCPICPSCCKPRTFYPKKNEYAATCGKKSCAAYFSWEHSMDREQLSSLKKAAWLKKTQEEKNKISEKRIKTNLVKYGTTAPAANQLIKEKTKKTCIKRYGVSSPFESSHVKEKIQETVLKRYGVSHPMQSAQVSQKVSETNMKSAYSRLPSKDKTQEVYGESGIHGIVEYYGTSYSNAFRFSWRNEDA